MRRALCGLAAAAALCVLLSAPSAAPQGAEPRPADASCGGAALCTVTGEAGEALGAYLIRQPEGAASAAPRGRPAILFMHGWRSSPQAVMRVAGLRSLADEIGAVLIAPEGLAQTWSYPGSPSQRRDEFAFFEALRRDVIARHGVDPERILVSGFSMGGSMAWYLACQAGDRYWAFAPFAGAFWHPLPKRCAAPAQRLLHIHGEADRTVPLAGRALGGGFRQGGAGESLDRLARGLRFERGAERMDQFDMRCTFWRGAAETAAAVETAAADETADRLYELCLHEGGHIWRPAWLRAAWDRLIAP